MLLQTSKFHRSVAGNGDDLKLDSIVMQYSFGQDDNLLGDESKAATLRKNITDLLLGVKVSQHFPWIFAFLNQLPFFIAKHIMPPGALDMLAFSKVSIFCTWLFISLDTQHPL